MADEPNDTPPNFFSLSGELRNRVYRYVVVTNGKIPISTTVQVTDENLTGSLNLVLPPLSQVCKRIRQEVHGIFVLENYFELSQKVLCSAAALSAVQRIFGPYANKLKCLLLCDARERPHAVCRASYLMCVHKARFVCSTSHGYDQCTCAYDNALAKYKARLIAAGSPSSSAAGSPTLSMPASFDMMEFLKVFGEGLRPVYGVDVTKTVVEGYCADCGKKCAVLKNEALEPAVATESDRGRVNLVNSRRDSDT